MDLLQKLEETKEWISDRIITARTLRQNLRNHLDPNEIPQQSLQQLKELLNEAKSKKTGITQLIKQDNDHLLHYDKDQPISFDLASLNQHWLELKHILKDLNKEARFLAGKKSEVSLYYTIGEPREVSPVSGFRIPSSNKKIGVGYLRRDPSKSLLKEKGRNWVTKLSIPYRIFIKSKVKQRYKGRSSTADTSFTSSDLNTITETSFDSVFISPRSYCSEPPQILDTSDLFLSADDGEVNEDVDSGSVQKRSTQSLNVKLDLMKATFPISTDNLSEAKLTNKENKKSTMASNVQSSSGSSSPKMSRPNTRASPVSIEEQSPISNKRRRLNSDDDSASSVTSLSPRDSPVPMTDDSPLPIMGGSARPLSLSPDSGDLKYPKPETRRGMAPQGSPLSKYFSMSPAGMSPLTTPGGTSTEDLSNLIFEGIDSSMNSSTMSSTMSTPVGSRSPRDFRKKYKKDELWAAIQSDYQYLMDEEIIETCKSTESDLSWESDEGPSTTTAVSFTEFLKQYNEMTDWLNQIQAATLRKADSLSEKYLNQTYHEEMLEMSKRKKLFHDNAKQLTKCYPTMRDEIQARLLRVNTQWQELEAIVSPQQDYQDEESMLKDLEEDLSSLRKWLHTVEGELTMQNPSPDWTPQVIQDKINSHKELQKDIESHSKIISSVLKVCERLQSDKSSDDTVAEKVSVQLVARNLEKRWHNIWLQSLEWQCRLEEALAGKGFRSRPSLDDLEDSLCEPVGTTPIGTQTDHCVGSSSFGTDPIDINADYGRFYIGKKKSGKSSGESDLEYYSDTSNYDVIPFSENEYEKIPIDTDTHTDDDYSGKQDDGKCSPDFSGRHEAGSGCDTDQGIDSALGRSYSDQSIGNETKSCPNIVGRATAGNKDDNNTQGAKIIVAKNVAEMNKGDAINAGTVKKGGQSRDASDVGYSSESHSNEELDTKIISKPRKITKSSAEEPSATSSPQLGNNRKAWRHSLTSAYDTASTGSDPNLHQGEDDDHLDLLESHNTSSEVTNITSNTSFHSVSSGNFGTPETIRSNNSASNNFYCMTSIDGDTDPSSSVDPASTYTNTGDRCESGNTSDLDSELSRSEIIPFDEDPAFSTCSTIPEEDMVNEDEKPNSRRRLEYGEHGQNGSSKMLPSDGTLSQEELDSLTDAATTLLKYVQKRKPLKKTDSLLVQVDSDASSRDQTISEDEINSNNVEQNGNNLTPQGPSDAVRKLIQQAESLVGDNDLLKLQNHKWPNYIESEAQAVKRRSGKGKHKRKVDAVSDSLNTSTDGSLVPRLSSCDASSEGDLSESCSEYSPTSSDGQGLPSIIEIEPKMTSSKSDNQVSDHLFGSVKLRHKNGKSSTERPCSVTELYERSSGLDLSPFSISEGAIHERSSSENLSHKLRKTLSEQSPLPVKRLDSPKKSRRRRSPPLKGRGKDRGSVSPVPSDSKQLNTTSTPHSRHVLHSQMDVQDGSSVTQAGTETGKSTTQVSSAVEFEENAWDHYQAPPYSSVSSDCGEEKLDASALQADWDHQLEFEEDFTGDQTYGVSRGQHRDKKYNRDKRVFEDSDSDLEDFQNVIMESQKALSFTDNTLRRPHKDPMDTGIYLDPSEYNETLATCRTQLKCLGVVVDTLQSEMELTNVTQENIQQVIDIIEEWRVLEKVASERLHQSQELSCFYKDMVSSQASLQDIEALVGRRDYRDCGELEQAIQALQETKRKVESEREKLKKVGASVVEYENNHDNISMIKFKSEIQNLQAYTNQLSKSSDSRSSELQSALISLYDFKEHHHGLQYSLDRERQQVRCLELATDLVTFSPQEVKDAIQDLKKLESEFPAYNGKLQLLRTLHADLAPHCHKDTELDTRAKIGLLDNQLAELRHKCESLGIKMQQRLSKGSAAAAAEASVGSGVSVDARPDTASVSTSTIPVQQPQRSLLMRVLRASLPFNLLLIAILILAYLLDPDIFENFGIVFSPQLKYVRGPPPT